MNRAYGYRELEAVLDHDAPPFDYNPSSWGHRAPVVALALIAATAAGYLALYQWGLIDTIWDPLFGDGTRQVLESEPAQTMRRWFGVPDAAIATLAYLGAALFCLVGSTRRWQYRPWIIFAFALDVILLAIPSAILVVMQGTRVGAWSSLCLVLAVIPLMLLALASDEIWAALKYLARVRRRTLGWRVTWDALWGRYDARAAEVCLRDVCDTKGVS